MRSRSEGPHRQTQSGSSRLPGALCSEGRVVTWPVPSYSRAIFWGHNPYSLTMLLASFPSNGLLPFDSFIFAMLRKLSAI